MKTDRPIYLLLVVLTLASNSFARVIDKPVAFRVKLLSPLDTTTSKKGDAVSAQVISPSDFAGDIMEGKVQEAKSGNKIKGKSVLSFTFDKLNHAGSVVPVKSAVQSMANSKGQQNVDEEGRVIQKKNSLAKVGVAGGAGAIIGGVLGGPAGAAIGAGIGSGAALILVEVAAKGPKIQLAAGSEFILTVQERRK